MAAHGVPTTRPEVEGGGNGRVPPIAIEILEDPWTPAAEVERIAANLARRAPAAQMTPGKPA